MFLKIFILLALTRIHQFDDFSHGDNNLECKVGLLEYYGFEGISSAIDY